MQDQCGVTCIIQTRQQDKNPTIHADKPLTNRTSIQELSDLPDELSFADKHAGIEDNRDSTLFASERAFSRDSKEVSGSK